MTLPGLPLDSLERALGRPPSCAAFSAVDEEGLPHDFKATKAFALVVDRIAFAQRIGACLALVTGAHGAGKTAAMKYFARQENVVYWECRAGYRPKHVLADIAQSMALSAGSGWRLQTSVVTEHLAEHPRLFLLDEAQRLNYESLDLLKYVGDNSGSTFVLAASPSLEKRIERWPDIASRCPVRAHVAPMELSEFMELYRDEGFSEGALAEIHYATKGVMRTVKALLRVIDEEMQEFNARTGGEATRASLGAGHIRMLAEGVIG